MRKFTFFFCLLLAALSSHAQDSKVEPIEIQKDSLLANYDQLLAGDSSDRLSTFKAAAFQSDGLLKEVVSEDGQMSSNQISLIREAKIGSKIYFHDIKTSTSEGLEKELPALVFVVKE